ncbi:AAA family ATPase [Meiothermus sp. CFH 77666]|uniref:ATP-binding protein n=1 Tax=Meiothermus sp. CFH 77666 TaxID=2817942 RepID=UPI001AA0AC0E|nr:AAA family ATPase [Meiothermus sp. CFH 77666]MBO1435928.1 AAA family ATPase [Meiothermus sp. CFH 77666]
MPTPACLYLLDEPHMRVGEVRHDLTPSRPVQLLVYLACRGEWVSREALAALFWPDSPEEEARHNLRVVLHRARALPWAGGLEVERERVRLLMDTDTAHFRQALGQARWEQAVRLHRRPFLQGFPLQDAPALEDWATLERESLLEAWQQAARHHAEALQQAEQHAEACKLLAEILRQNLLSEDVLQDYLRAAYLAGQREAALKLYERFAGELRQELGLEPMRATQELAQALRRSEPLQAVPPKPPPRIPLEVLRPPRLVGREAEQARLRGSSALLVHGEPGVGKSRLLQEVFPQAPLLRAREGLENVPFYPVLDYLKANLANLPDLGPYREDLARLLPEAYPGFAPPPGEPGSAKARLLEALARALAPAGRLLFDDLQWADEGTLELLLYLHSRGQPWAGAYRSHEVGPALAKAIEALRGSGAEELALEPLAAPSVQALLADLIGVEEGPPVFAGWLHGQTGGNPFFALETLKALFENGVLRAEQGQWHTDLDEVTRDYSELQIPPKVAEVIRRRVGRLSEPALRVVQAASVVGEGFGPRLLAGVTGLSEWAVLGGLEEAETLGLMQSAQFTHDLIRQGVYSDLPSSRRTMLHSTVAQSLGEADPALRARHHQAAGELERASRLWEEAAEGTPDAAVAVGLLRRALETNADPRRKIELELKLIQQLGGAGLYEEGKSRLEALLQQSLSVSQRACALALLAGVHVQNMQVALAEPILADLEQNYPFDLLDEHAQVTVGLLRKSWHFQKGEYDLALDMARKLAEIYAQHHDPATRFDLVLLKNDMGAQLTQLGRLDEARRELEEAFALAQALHSRHGKISCMSNLVYYWIVRGEPAQILAPARAVLAEDPAYEEGRTDNLEVNLGTACLRLERWEEAIGHYEAVRQKGRHPMFGLLARTRLFGLYHQTGQPEKAHRALQEALTFLPKTAHLPTRAILLTLSLQHGTPEELAMVRQAVEPLERTRLPREVRAQLEAAEAARG